MKAHLIDTHLLVPRSRSSAKVKVKYQGNVSQKMGVSGALVVHKHIFFPLHKHFHEAVSSRGSEVLNVPWSVIECKKKNYRRFSNGFLLARKSDSKDK